MGMFDRARREREFDEELASHLEMHAQDNIRAGMTPASASRRRVIGQLLTESVLLALCGSVLAVVLAGLSAGMLNALPQSVLPRTEDIHIDGMVLAYTAFIAVLTGVLFGLAPAWRSMDVDPAEALQQGARTAGTPAGTV